MVVGEPDAPVPPLIAEAGIRAIQAGRIGYTQSLGIAELRDAISGLVPHALWRRRAALANRRDHGLVGRVVADHGRVAVAGQTRC